MVSASQGTAHLLATLVLVQAIIAGRSDRPFGSWDIGVHEILGNIVFDVALVGLESSPGRVAPASCAPPPSPSSSPLRRTRLLRANQRRAAAWHIPNGVAIFGLAVYNITATRRS